MRGAQMLYESGYITYMRTDSDKLSEVAALLAHKTAQNSFGINSVKEIVHNDEDSGAHEPIRPAIWNETFVRPEDLPSHSASNGIVIPPKFLSLYEIIYSRTLASVMNDMVTNITSLTLFCDEVCAEFRVSTSSVVDLGFSSAFQAGSKVKETLNLDSFEIGEVLSPSNVTAIEHITSPPSRYSEAAFVKELELLGIGR